MCKSLSIVHLCGKKLSTLLQKSVINTLPFYQLLQTLTNCFLSYYAPCLFCSWRAGGCSTALSHWCLARLITAPASRKGLINRRLWEFMPNSCQNKVANLFTSIRLSPDDSRCVLSKNFKAGWNKSMQWLSFHQLSSLLFSTSYDWDSTI